MKSTCIEQQVAEELSIMLRNNLRRKRHPGMNHLSSLLVEFIFKLCEPSMHTPYRSIALEAHIPRAKVESCCQLFVGIEFHGIALHQRVMLKLTFEVLHCDVPLTHVQVVLVFRPPNNVANCLLCVIGPQILAGLAPRRDSTVPPIA